MFPGLPRPTDDAGQRRYRRGKEVATVTDDDLFKACEQHGARRVYDAAYARLIGDLKALPAVRLPGIIDLSEAHTVLRVAYGCRRAENEAAGPALGGRSEHDQRDHGHPGEHEQGSSKRRERE